MYSEEVLSDIHARIDGIKATVDQVAKQKGGGFWKFLTAVAVVAAGVAIAIALSTKNDSVQKSDLDALSDQVSSMQQQVSSQSQNVQSQIDAAVKQATQGQSSSGGGGASPAELKAIQADIDNIKAYLRNPQGAFGPGNGKVPANGQ
jgi:hypothetical protein